MGTHKVMYLAGKFCECLLCGMFFFNLCLFQLVLILPTEKFNSSVASCNYLVHVPPSFVKIVEVSSTPEATPELLDDASDVMEKKHVFFLHLHLAYQLSLLSSKQTFRKAQNIVR